MQPAVMSKSHRSAQDRRPREMDVARFEHDRLIEGPALAASVVLADEDAQQHRVARQGHGLGSLGLVRGGASSGIDGSESNSAAYTPSGETPNSQ